MLMAIRNAKRAVAPSAVCVVNDDGSITFRGKRITASGIHLERVIGSGANGFVVKGMHRILSRPVAVKFWASLRTRDSRDKMAQGIAEVNKQFKADNYRSVVLVRTAGEAEGIFYAVMDLFHGRTLEAWLEDSPPLGLRRLVARRLVDDVCAMSHDTVYHGDLHSRNVLVDSRVTSLLDGREPRLGIIDFGTSLFVSGRASRARHWRVFGETLNRLVWPFELRQLALTPFPPSGATASIRTWYQTALASIRHVLVRLGAEGLIDPEETHEFHKGEWVSRAAMLCEIFPVPQTALEFTRKLINAGALDLSEQSLGPGHLWWPRPRPLSSSTLDGVGPPWNNSMTDEVWW